eukprot:6594540-Prymnesium_polylepis.1
MQNAKKKRVDISRARHTPHMHRQGALAQPQCPFSLLSSRAVLPTFPTPPRPRSRARTLARGLSHVPH